MLQYTLDWYLSLYRWDHKFVWFDQMPYVTTDKIKNAVTKN